MSRIALMTLACASLVTVALAGEPDPRQLKERADVLERRAQKLKAEGEHDKAQAAMREVEELRAQTRNLGRPEKERAPEDLRLQELQRERKRALAELEKLRGAGKEEQAIEVKRHIQEIDEQLARMERPEGRQPQPDRPGMARRPQNLEREAAAMDPEQRMKHIEVAVDNLHAAGMHEAADRLASQAQALRQREWGGRPGFQGRGPQAMPRAELEQLRAEVQELRQAVRELRARLEQSERR